MKVAFFEISRCNEHMTAVPVLFTAIGHEKQIESMKSVFDDDEIVPLLFYCKDDAHIYSSITKTTSVLRKDIEEFIDRFACVDNVFHGNPNHERIMQTEFTKYFGCSVKDHHTCYFHGTRCLPRITFADGLLPLSVAIDAIWDSLFELVSEDETRESWKTFRTEFEASSEAKRPGGYWWRVKNTREREAGPWGKLIREEWLIDGRDDNHYIHEGPEIITVISMACKDKTGIDLSGRYLKASRGCIVHFSTTKFDKWALGGALLWLLHKSKCPDWLQDGFYGLESMCGQLVAPTQILEVERLQ